MCFVNTALGLTIRKFRKCISRGRNGFAQYKTQRPLFPTGHPVAIYFNLMEKFCGDYGRKIFAV